MSRIFLHSSSHYGSLLRENERHLFAMRHALRLYSKNAIYSFIPKNACSTMRISLALANGCIRDKQDFNWIHENNDTFSTDLASALLADYTFIILRCPYSRLASAYLDVVIDKYGKNEDEEVSFDFFIRQLHDKNIRKLNIHWRPQVDFLLYEQYDDYFAFEEFAQIGQKLKTKLNFSVVDARNLTKNGTDQFTLIGEPGKYAHHSAFSIMQLKCRGQCPSHLALYTDELVAMVKDFYGADIKLYQSLFGSKNLMFN